MTFPLAYRSFVARAAARPAIPLAVLLSAALAVALPGAASAGIIVTQGEGGIAIGVDIGPPDFPEPVSNFTVDLPGADTRILSERFTGSFGSVTYDVDQPDADTLRGAFETRIATQEPAEGGGTRFLMEFTSDLPLRFRFRATAQSAFGSTFFAATLDDIVADARVTAPGEVSGTIPFDPASGLGEFVRTGTLPAGDHRFMIEARTGAGFAGAPVAESAGEASFEVVAVPLPPAAWAGLATFGGWAASRHWRRRRRACGQGL